MHGGNFTFGNVRDNFKIARLNERQNGLSRGDDLSDFRVDVRDDTVGVCCQVRVFERVLTLSGLSDCGVVSGFGGVELRSILVEHGGGNRFGLEQLCVTIQIRFGKFELRQSRGHLRFGTVGLFDDVFRVERHQNFARVDD